MTDQTRILFVGDIVGRPGRDALKVLLPTLREEYSPDMVIVNGENSAGGFGITPEIADGLLALGADVITSGNHIWDQRDIYGYLGENPRLLRPLNFPRQNPGGGLFVHECPGGVRVGVVNLAGRVFMSNTDCPFAAVEAAVERLSSETPLIFVDMHAETTSEKYAMGHFLDGRVSAVVGTHTHVQTADERILPKGTAFISDAGMTGPTNSVIGMKKEMVIERFLTQRPVRFEVARSGVELQGVFMTVDSSSGKALSIERIKSPL